MPGQMNITKAHQTRSGLLSFKNGVSALVNTTLDLIYPPRCSGCGQPDTTWCARCELELDSHPFNQHLRTISPILSAASTGPHEGRLKEAIWALKYDGAQHLAIPLAKRIVILLDELPYPFETLIPVPIHTARFEQRGYNQAKLLTDYVCKVTGVPMNDSAILRHQNTRSQVGLTLQERQENVTSAFTYYESLSGRRVLLVDDVLTTGATLSACANAAYQAGAIFVFGITVAHGSSLASR